MITILSEIRIERVTNQVILKYSFLPKECLGTRLTWERGIIILYSLRSPVENTVACFVAFKAGCKARFFIRKLISKYNSFQRFAFSKY